MILTCQVTNRQEALKVSSVHLESEQFTTITNCHRKHSSFGVCRNVQ